jgi:hypothetical protein
LWITNDTLAPVSDEARVRLAGFDRTTHAEATFGFEIGPNESRRVGTLDVAGGPDRYLTVSGATFASNRQFFVPIKDLRRDRPHVEHQRDGTTVRLRSDGYAYLVRLGLTDEHVRASDDCFELEPGEERTITLSEPAEIQLSWL